MAWDEIKKLMYQGGLGLRSLMDVNLALYRKWFWRLMNGNGSLQWRVIEANWDHS